MVYILKIPSAVGHSSMDAMRNEFVRLRKELGKLLSCEEDFEIGEKEMEIIQSFDEKTLVRQVQILEEKVAAQKRFLRHYEEESSFGPDPGDAASMGAGSSKAAYNEDPAIDALMEEFSRLRAGGLPPAEEFIRRKMYEEMERQGAWGPIELVPYETSSPSSERVTVYGFGVRKKTHVNAPINDSLDSLINSNQPSTSASKPTEPLTPHWIVPIPLEGVAELLEVTSEPRHYTVFAAIGLQPQFKTFPSPWYIPLAFGWNRYVSGKTLSTSVCTIYTAQLDENGDVVYKTPYEKELRTLREVATYLQTYEPPLCYSKHFLSIGFFSFSKGLDPCRQVLASDLADANNFIDFTNGLVWPPVVIRKKPYNLPLPKMEYVKQRILSEGVAKALAKERLQLPGCECTDGCLDPTKCACRQKTLKRLSNECPKSLRPKNAVCEYGTLTERIPTGIYACNERCACRKKPAASIHVFPSCSNLVIHRGSAIPMEMWRTKEMGWSVRTLVDIPKGAFVVTYVGKIITDAEANHCEDSTYHANLNFPLLGRKRPFVVDGKFYGNVAAFINHSCEPNLFAQHVFTDVHHDRLPEIALFAERDITAGEDLNWDYCYENQKRVPCKCGSKNCRGWLM